jgi:hypothetical protein
MKTIQEISEFKRKASGPLTINGRNIVDLAQTDPKAAYDLVFEAVDRRGGHKALLNHRSRQSCVREAMAVPLPGASENIFKGPIKVGSRLVLPVVPIHFAVLQALESPLLQLISEATSNKKAELKNPTQEQKWEICHVFTADAKQLFRQLKTQGAGFIREQSAEVVGMEWESAEIELAMPAIMEQLQRHIETTIRFATEMEASKQVRFFQMEKTEEKSEASTASASVG